MRPSRRRNWGGGGGGAEGALAPPIVVIMCIKYAEFILDTPFGPPQSCLRSYTSVLETEEYKSFLDMFLLSIYHHGHVVLPTRDNTTDSVR